MADQTSPIQQIAAGSNAVDRINENFDAGSPALLWGRDARTTGGLTWGYVGGRWGDVARPNGTVSLAANAANYVVASLATGEVSASTGRVAWDNGDEYLRLYLVTTGPATVIGYEDRRQAYGGGGGGGGSVLAVVVAITEASHDVEAVESGAYLRFTAAAAKTCTFRPDTTHALPVNGEWHIRNAATAGNLTLAPGAGVILNPPYAGTLVVPPGGTVTVKRVALDLFDVMGVTA